MKKIWLATMIAVAILVVAPLVVLPLVGLSITDIKANLYVGTGMGAKLACSGRYVTGLNAEQVKADLSSYSAALDILNIQYDDVGKTAHVSAFGLVGTTARYRPGLGCTLEIGDTSALDRVDVPVLPATAGSWPGGEVADAIDPAVQAQTELILARDNEAGLQTRALLVIHDGQLVAESYGESFDWSTPLLGWSMGKSLTAIMLGHLEMLEQISAVETNLFPEWQNDDRRDISIEHLLHMSSGLDFAEVYAPGSDATHMLFTAYSASDVAIASTLAHVPGAHFSYSSGTANLLARLIVDRVGGTQAAMNYLVNRIYAPLGIRHATLEPDPSGIFVGSSYAYASPRDWARLGQLMLNKGELNGQRVVSQAWVARAMAPNGSLNNPAYGYQFWLNHGRDDLRWPSLPEDAYAMSGNRQQSVMIIPSANTVLVRLGWTSGQYPLDENLAELLVVL